MSLIYQRQTALDLVSLRDITTVVQYSNNVGMSLNPAVKMHFLPTVKDTVGCLRILRFLSQSSDTLKGGGCTSSFKSYRTVPSVCNLRIFCAEVMSVEFVIFSSLFMYFRGSFSRRNIHKGYRYVAFSLLFTFFAPLVYLVPIFFFCIDAFSSFT